MSEEKKEVTTNGEEIITKDEKDDTTNGSEVSIETLNVQKRKALEQRDEARKNNEEITRKYEELQKTLDELNKKSTSNTSNTSNNSNEEIKRVEEKIAKIEFLHSHPNIDQEDVNEILTLAKLNNKTIEEALEFPMVKVYLKAKEEEKRIANATTNSTRSVKGSNGKTFSDMSTEEKKSHTKELWDKAVRGEL